MVTERFSKQQELSWSSKQLSFLSESVEELYGNIVQLDAL